jgi:hypothetical protein
MKIGGIDELSINEGFEFRIAFELESHHDLGESSIRFLADALIHTIGMGIENAVADRRDGAPQEHHGTESTRGGSELACLISFELKGAHAHDHCGALFGEKVAAAAAKTIREKSEFESERLKHEHPFRARGLTENGRERGGYSYSLAEFGEFLAQAAGRIDKAS